MINFHEFDSIMIIVRNLFTAFGGITDYLTLSPADILHSLNIPVLLPSAIAGITPLGLLLGVGLPVYLGYQFVTWLLNVIT